MSVSQYVRFAIRRLIRERSFAATSVATIAIGVAATTSIFAVVNGVVARPLPYAGADRLVHLISHGMEGTTPSRSWVMSLPYFTAVRERATTLSAIGGYDSFSSVTRQRLAVTVDGPQGAARLQGTRISPALLAMVGVQPVLGRYFGPGEEAPGAHNVIILSHRTWQATYGADPEVLGRTVTIDNRVYVVIGVMPAGFALPDVQTDFWIPLTPAQLPPPSEPRTDSPNTYYADAVFGRLADGVSPSAAGQEVDAILRAVDLEIAAQRSPALARTYQERASLPRRAEAVLMQDELVAPVRPALRLFSIAVGLLLLIACANVTNLVLARSEARARDMAIRAALGAGPRQLVGHVLTETLILALAGGALGTILARWALEIVIPLIPAGMPRLDEVALNVPVLLFSLAVSSAAGVTVALFPALRVMRADPMDAMIGRASLGFAGAGAWRFASRTPIVVAEIAMATVLLIGAGLLVRSFLTLVNVQPGYDVRNVLTFQVIVPSDYADQAGRAYGDVLDRLEAHPVVQAAAMTDVLPIAGNSAFHFAIDGLPHPPGPDDRMVMRIVSRDYFEAMGIALVGGRSFSDGGASGAAEQVLVNREFVRRYFRGEHPIGRIIGRSPATYEVIGIVDNVRHAGLDAAVQPEYYVDFRRFALASAVRPFFAVRAGGGADLAPVIRSVVREVNPRFGVDLNVRTMREIVRRSIERPRFHTTLVVVFAGVAVLLAAIGIYGVVAWSVGERTHEIGTRMALGAHRGAVIRMIVGQSAAMIGAGLVLGLAGAAALTRYLEGLLFGLTALDPATFVAVPLLFAVVALAAAYFPARRAAAVDPLVALRCE